MGVLYCLLIPCGAPLGVNMWSQGGWARPGRLGPPRHLAAGASAQTPGGRAPDRARPMPRNRSKCTRNVLKSMGMYICIYIYTYTYVYIYIQCSEIYNINVYTYAIHIYMFTKYTYGEYIDANCFAVNL